MRKRFVDGWIRAATLEFTASDLDEIVLAVVRTGAGTGPPQPATAGVQGAR